MGKKKRIRWNIDLVREFVEGEEGNGCKLISEEYVDMDGKLVYMCKCGENFEATFLKFFHRNQRQCKSCGIEKRTKLKRHTIESVRKFIEVESKSGCKLLSTVYVDNKSEIRILCKCGNEYSTCFNTFQSSKKYQCNECRSKDMSEKFKLTLDEVKEFIEENSDCVLLSTEYISSTSKLKLKCGCGATFETSFSSFKHADRRRCRKCGLEKRANLKRLTYDYVKNAVEEESNGKCKLLSETYKDTRTKMLFSCECGETFITTFDEYRHGDKKRCSICSGAISKGELSVMNCLQNKNIKFKSEYEFDGLIGIGGFPLRFDFAIFDDCKCLKFLCEYDGEFHTKKIHEHHDLETQQIHDERKNQYCKENNIPLLRIPYWEFNNIEQILDKTLSKYNLIN